MGIHQRAPCAKLCPKLDIRFYKNVYCGSLTTIRVTILRFLNFAVHTLREAAVASMAIAHWFQMCR